MHALEQHIYHAFTKKMLAWPPIITDTIYAVSFFLSAEEDDMRRMTVTLGYNTYQQWHISLRRASTPQEAKWNYAFWLQNAEVTIGTAYGSVDIIGISLRESWLKAQDLWYSDEEEKYEFHRVVPYFPIIEQKFIQCCVTVAQQLHAQGVISRVFNCSIPIIIHELEYYDAVAIQTTQGNPPGITQEYTDWIMSMYEKGL